MTFQGNETIPKLHVTGNIQVKGLKRLGIVITLQIGSNRSCAANI